MSDACVQPSGGATPPNVFTRWMKVVRVNLRPPVGPAWTPACFTRSHGMAFGRTKGASVDDADTLPQTVLESFECCHAARITPCSAGFGPKKCVVTCRMSSSNKVASGVNNDQLTPAPAGRHT